MNEEIKIKSREEINAEKLTRLTELCGWLVKLDLVNAATEFDIEEIKSVVSRIISRVKEIEKQKLERSGK